MSKNKDQRNNNEIEIPPKELWPVMDNPFIKDYKNGKIVYSKDFYVALYKKIESGMTYVKAYESLGLDIKILGEDRANACGRRAVQMAREGRLNRVDPSSYDGSVGPELMGEMTMEEEYAYLKARNAYLEEAYKLKKKFLSELAGRPVSSIIVKKD